MYFLRLPPWKSGRFTMIGRMRLNKFSYNDCLKVDGLSCAMLPSWLSLKQQSFVIWKCLWRAMEVHWERQSAVFWIYAFVGKCICDHNTTGEHCERCLDGFFGFPTTGTPDDCRPCPCPEESKCVELLSGEVACFDCPFNRTGKLCRFHLPCILASSDEPSVDALLSQPLLQLWIVILVLSNFGFFWCLYLLWLLFSS